MNEILLTGCAPTPLADYLKALGVLRLVSEQKDESAKGYWCEDGFLLQTSLSDEEFSLFFLNEYSPSPIFTPWNGGSGFFYQETKSNEVDPETGKKIKTGVRNNPTTATKTIDAVISAKADRLVGCKDIAMSLKQMVEDYGLFEAPKNKKIKREFIEDIRSNIDDSFLISFDSCVAISDEKLLLPPIFGSGGNDGNLDFSNNFHQQILRLMCPETGAPTREAKAELESALFRKTIPAIQKGAVGQFSPGAAGGPNSSTGFEGGSAVNGWDYLLMMEGALLFAAGISRRMEKSSRAGLSFPFTVRSSGSGSGSVSTSDEKDSRNEIWMPLWNRPTSKTELETFMREGRASVNARGCRDGLDFARAAAQLGVDRGVTAFQRFGFLKRSGKAYHATPMGRVQVCQAPEAKLIDELDNERTWWLSAMRAACRAKEAGGLIRSIVQLLEKRIFDLTRHPTGEIVRRLLVTIGELAILQGKSAKLRKRYAFIPSLSWGWVKAAGEHDDAFRIACALASIGGEGGLPLRAHIFPLEKPKSRKLKTDGKSKLCTWNRAPLTTELSNLLERRFLSCRQGDHALELTGRSPVSMVTLVAFLENPALDQSISELLPGLCLVRKHYPSPRGDGTEKHWPPLAYRILKPFFCDQEELVKAGVIDEDEKLPLLPEMVRFLKTNQTGRALELAVRRLRAAGLKPPGIPPDTSGLEGKRLLSCLLLPVYGPTLQSIVKRTFNIKTDHNMTEKE